MTDKSKKADAAPAKAIDNTGLAHDPSAERRSHRQLVEMLRESDRRLAQCQFFKKSESKH